MSISSRPLSCERGFQQVVMMMIFHCDPLRTRTCQTAQATVGPVGSELLGWPLSLSTGLALGEGDAGWYFVRWTHRSRRLDSTRTVTMQPFRSLQWRHPCTCEAFTEELLIDTYYGECYVTYVGMGAPCDVRIRIFTIIYNQTAAPPFSKKNPLLWLLFFLGQFFLHHKDLMFFKKCIQNSCFHLFLVWALQFS